MSIEQNIQKNKNIIEAVNGSADALKWIYNQFSDDKVDSADINDVEIYEGCQTYEDEARAIKTYFIPNAVREAHNRYVALLIEWRMRSQDELNQLLIKNERSNEST